MPYHVFVGTLFSGEGDFNECIQSINRQRNVKIEHFVVSNKPEKEAHNELFNKWIEVKSEFDFFTKIDADTVLAHPFVIEYIGKMFDSNARFTSIQAPLDDYMTNGYINGLNSYTKRVVFNTAPELYCDRVDTNHDIQVMSNQVVGELRPAGFHCYHATPIQAFHFGLHRALKRQSDIINQVRLAYNKNTSSGFRDDIRAFAIAGAAAALDCKDRHNYTDARFQELFQAAQAKIISAE